MAQILERYGRRQGTELIFCRAYFNLISRFLESTRVELEAADLVGGKTPTGVVRG